VGQVPDDISIGMIKDLIDLEEDTCKKKEEVKKNAKRRLSAAMIRK